MDVRFTDDRPAAIVRVNGRVGSDTAPSVRRKRDLDLETEGSTDEPAERTAEDAQTSLELNATA